MSVPNLSLVASHGTGCDGTFFRPFGQASD